MKGRRNDRCCQEKKKVGLYCKIGERKENGHVLKKGRRAWKEGESKKKGRCCLKERKPGL